MKQAFEMKQKSFFITFKELSLKQTKRIFLQGDSATLTAVAKI